MLALCSDPSSRQQPSSVSETPLGGQRGGFYYLNCIFAHTRGSTHRPFRFRASENRVVRAQGIIRARPPNCGIPPSPPQFSPCGAVGVITVGEGEGTRPIPMRSGVDGRLFGPKCAQEQEGRHVAGVCRVVPACLV